jgi:hypothetical protein
MLRLVTSVLVCCVVTATATVQPASAEGVPPVTDLVATPGARQVRLSWTNPTDAGFAGVVVRIAPGAEPPTGPEQGTGVYDGAEQSTAVTGLASGAWYSFAVFSYDSARSSGEPATVSVRTALATALSITRSAATITYGRSVVIAGRLTEAGTVKGVSGVPVEVHFRRRGTTEWTHLKTVQTATTGGWSAPVTPSFNVDYRARSLGSADHEPAASRRVAVDVRTAVSAKLSAHIVRLGRRVTLSGGVAPNHQGQQVVLQRRYSGAWHTDSTATLSSRSRYAFPVGPRSYGIYHYRVVKPADDDHAASATSQRRLQVYARTYTYNVCFRGTITADKRKFADTVAAVYGHPRAWARAGKRFVRIDTSCSRSKATSDFTVWLAAADRIPTFPGCYDRNFSCRSGDNVVINQTRWQKGARARGWNIGLANYRALVVNHETGHWFGLKHLSCPGAGRPAPVMQQQSIALRGCRPNPWPTDREIRAMIRSRR